MKNIFYICIQVFHVVNGQKFRCSSYSKTSEVHELYNLKKQLFVSLEEKIQFKADYLLLNRRSKS